MFIRLYMVYEPVILWPKVAFKYVHVCCRCNFCFRNNTHLEKKSKMVIYRILYVYRYVNKVVTYWLFVSMFFKFVDNWYMFFITCIWMTKYDYRIKDKQNNFILLTSVVLVLIKCQAFRDMCFLEIFSLQVGVLNGRIIHVVWIVNLDSTVQTT